MRAQDSLPDFSQEGPETRNRAGVPSKETGPDLLFCSVGVAGFEPTTSSSRTLGIAAKVGQYGQDGYDEGQVTTVFDDSAAVLRCCTVRLGGFLGQEHAGEAWESTPHLLGVVEVEVLAHVAPTWLLLVFCFLNGVVVRVIVSRDLFESVDRDVVDELGEEEARASSSCDFSNGGMVGQGVRVGDNSLVPVSAKGDNASSEIDEAVVAATTIDQVRGCPDVPPVQIVGRPSKVSIEAEHGGSAERRQSPDKFLGDGLAAVVLIVIVSAASVLGSRNRRLHQRPELVLVHGRQSCIAVGSKAAMGSSLHVSWVEASPPPEGGRA